MNKLTFKEKIAVMERMLEKGDPLLKDVTLCMNRLCTEFDRHTQAVEWAFSDFEDTWNHFRSTTSQEIIEQVLAKKPVL